MSDGKTTNINIGGGTIGGLQIGDGNTQSNTQHFGKPEATIPAVFDAVKESLQELPEAGRDEFVNEVVEPLRLMANLPIAQQQERTTLEKAQALFERLSPFAPTINKAVLAFGEASLSALASNNPIVSGLLATVKAIKG
ncbi:MAG: hypothetical protein IT422_05015 [Pirellulaceae bacterium]|nr:hypothetical protein [Pirellulaceae bacterium]